MSAITRKAFSFVRFFSIHSKDTRSVHDHGTSKTPITSQLWRMRMAEIEKDTTMKVGDSVESTVVTKSCSDSRLSLQYSFSTDIALRDLYVDHKGNVLVGKIFEDLDALAGNIANTHCEDGNPNSPRLGLVTASVDRIVQTKAIPISSDLTISGQVAWVGKSSLDIVVDLYSADDPSHRLLSSFFTYVARNRETGKAALVNKLHLASQAEVALFDVRQGLAQSRKASRQLRVIQGDDAKLMEELLQAGHAAVDMPALAPTGSVLMRSTFLENSFVCQPQNVNTSGRVFGGFISECSPHGLVCKAL